MGQMINPDIFDFLWSKATEEEQGDLITCVPEDVERVYEWEQKVLRRLQNGRD